MLVEHNSMKGFKSNQLFFMKMFNRTGQIESKCIDLPNRVNSSKCYNIIEQLLPF